MKFETEKEMEDLIYSYWENIGIVPIDKTPYDILLRQPNIPGYGVPDLIGISHDISCVRVRIFELKNTKLIYDNVGQICRYYRGIERYFKKFYPNVDLQLSGVLVGTGMSLSNDFCYLQTYIDWLSIYIAEVNMNGVKFVLDEKNWYATSETNKKIFKEYEHEIKQNYIDFCRENNGRECE